MGPCGKNHTTGYFMVLRKTIGKSMAAKLKKSRQQLRARLHLTSDVLPREAHFGVRTQDLNFR